MANNSATSNMRRLLGKVPSINAAVTLALKIIHHATIVSTNKGRYYLKLSIRRMIY